MLLEKETLSGEEVKGLLKRHRRSPRDPPRHGVSFTARSGRSGREGALRLLSP